MEAKAKTQQSAASVASAASPGKESEKNKNGTAAAAAPPSAEEKAAERYGDRAIYLEKRGVGRPSKAFLEKEKRALRDSRRLGKPVWYVNREGFLEGEPKDVTASLAAEEAEAEVEVEVEVETETETAAATKKKKPKTAHAARQESAGPSKLQDIARKAATSASASAPVRARALTHETETVDLSGEGEDDDEDEDEDATGDEGDEDGDEDQYQAQDQRGAGQLKEPLTPTPPPMPQQATKTKRRVADQEQEPEPKATKREAKKAKAAVPSASESESTPVVVPAPVLASVPSIVMSTPTKASAATATATATAPPATTTREQLLVMFRVVVGEMRPEDKLLMRKILDEEQGASLENFPTEPLRPETVAYVHSSGRKKTVWRKLLDHLRTFVPALALDANVEFVVSCASTSPSALVVPATPSDAETVVAVWGSRTRDWDDTRFGNTYAEGERTGARMALDMLRAYELDADPRVVASIVPELKKLCGAGAPADVTAYLRDVRTLTAFQDIKSSLTTFLRATAASDAPETAVHLKVGPRGCSESDGLNAVPDIVRFVCVATSAGWSWAQKIAPQTPGASLLSLAPTKLEEATKAIDGFNAQLQESMGKHVGTDMEVDMPAWFVDSYLTMLESRVGTTDVPVWFAAVKTRSQPAVPIRKTIRLGSAGSETKTKTKSCAACGKPLHDVVAVVGVGGGDTLAMHGGCAAFRALAPDMPLHAAEA